jgi:hypothetical protein
MNCRILSLHRGVRRRLSCFDDGMYQTHVKRPSALSACVQGQLWFNLDSAFSPIYIQILPLVASRDPLKWCAAHNSTHCPVLTLYTSASTSNCIMC